MTVAVFLALAPFMVLTAFFSIEVALGLAPVTRRSSSLDSAPSAVVVIPAHDEAQIIGKTLSRLKGAVSTTMRILVVADNCADATAEQARAAGVDVIERSESGRRGKGYALGFAVEHLASSAPDVLVILDADCFIDRESLRALVDGAAEGHGPRQAVNLLRPDLAAAPLVQISGFAFMLKNLVRQRGLQRLAGRVHLTGTGMAIPFALLSGSSLANADVVEDLSLGLQMSARGHPPKLVPDALVESHAAREDETLTQRRRWEGGFIATSLRRAPPMLFDAIRKGDLRSGAAALDLMVPPLALFVLINISALVAAAIIVAMLRLSIAPLGLDALVLVVAAVLVFVTWLREGRAFLSFSALLKVPLYVAWKLPLYLSLARRGAPREWLRTRR